MSERQVNAGTKMFFGVPASPMPKIMADAIGQLSHRFPGFVKRTSHSAISKAMRKLAKFW